MRSRCFKLYRVLPISFNLSNLGNFCLELNSKRLWLTSYGTTLTVRKFERRRAVQKFEHENRGQIFNRYVRKFGRQGVKHRERLNFCTAKGVASWMRGCSAGKRKEDCEHGFRSRVTYYSLCLEVLQFDNSE